MKRALCATALLALVFAGAASAEPRLTVPRTAAVGGDVRVVLRGFPRNARVEIHLIPTINRGGNCCGIQARLRAGRRTNGSGNAVARFRWPRYYERCGASACERVRWRQNQRVDVLVLVRTVRRIRVVRLTA